MRTYEISHYWTDYSTGGCITQIKHKKAATAEDALSMFRVEMDPHGGSKDRYFNGPQSIRDVTEEEKAEILAPEGRG